MDNGLYIGIVDVGIPSIRVYYKGQVISFHASLYRDNSRTKNKDRPTDYLEVINRFILELPEQRQDQLWMFYKTVRDILDTTNGIRELEYALKEAIKTFSNLFTVEELVVWYRDRSRCPISSEFKTRIEDLNNPTLITREQTYLVDDYIGLCGLGLAMNLLSPIFSAYVDKTSREISAVWKLYQAYLLLNGSTYGKSKEMARLYEYIKATLSNDTSLSSSNYTSSIIAGISEEEYPNYLLGCVLVRKVSMGDVSGRPESTPLIKCIYKYVQQKKQGLDREFGNGIVVREPDDKSNDDDNAVSQLEVYFQRQPFSDNMIWINQYYLSDITKLITSNFPDASDEDIELLLYHRDLLMKSQRIARVQVVMAMWICNSIIPSRILDYVEREALVNAMLYTQYWLWHHGFHELALLSTALPVINDDLVYSGFDKRSRVNQELKEHMDRAFPYYLKNTGKKSTKIETAIERSAQAIETLFNQHEWECTAHPSLIQSDHLKNNRTRRYVPEDIRIQIVKLALFINEQQQGQ